MHVGQSGTSERCVFWRVIAACANSPLRAEDRADDTGMSLAVACRTVG
uniref:Uncharacterized protein n=1 Tax=Anguilla anguilla TaxID=7936 RepID=A0A0E9TJZ4_ANGAN